jgi:hypothetical protein
VLPRCRVFIPADPNCRKQILVPSEFDMKLLEF